MVVRLARVAVQAAILVTPMEAMAAVPVPISLARLLPLGSTLARALAWQHNKGKHMQIEIIETGNVLTEAEFYDLHPTTAFPQPLTDDALADFSARLFDEPVDVDALRSAARAQIEQWRDQQEHEGITFTHDGRAWDGGLIVRQRLQPVVSLPALPPGFFWTDHDNNDVPVTLSELRELSAAHEVALVTRGFEIHARQRAMKAAVAGMDAEQLQVFAPGW